MHFEEIIGELASAGVRHVVIGGIAFALNVHGSAYSVSDEQIGKFMKLTPAEKLRRLDDLESFLALAMTARAKAIREKFRRGEVS